MYPQEKALKIMDYISNHLYFCSPDMRIGKEEFNSNLLISTLTSVNKGKQIFIGDPGDGKTSIAEYFLSFVYGIPRRVLISSAIRGSDELTIEKIIGRLDFGELNKGNEKVHWSLFVSLEPKIFDEFNKCRPDKQNLVLDGLDRGNWSYLNEMIPTGDYSLFAMSNPNDSNGYPLGQAVLDRIGMAVPVDQPDQNDYRLMRHNMIGAKRKLEDYILNDAEIENEMYGVLKSDEKYETKIQKMQALQEKFKKRVQEKTGLELLTSQELEETIEKISHIDISTEANLLYDVLRAELGSCMHFGKKRINEECISGCHYKDFMCGKKKNSDSGRNQKAEMKYTQALAWLLGDSKIEPKHIAAIEPFFLWHRIDFTPEYANKFKEDGRDPCLPFHIAQQATNEMIDRFSHIKNELYEETQLVKRNQIEDAKKLAKKVDHPAMYGYFKRKII